MGRGAPPRPAWPVRGPLRPPPLVLNTTDNPPFPIYVKKNFLCHRAATTKPPGGGEEGGAPLWLTHGPFRHTERAIRGPPPPPAPPPPTHQFAQLLVRGRDTATSKHSIRKPPTPSICSTFGKRERLLFLSV